MQKAEGVLLRSQEIGMSSRMYVTLAMHCDAV